MNFLSKKEIQEPGADDVVFRISPWGSFFGLLVLLIGLLVGVAFLIRSYQSSIIWGVVFSSLYILILWIICRVLFRVLLATRSPANWLARIGPGGILLKYRSYLHDDSPEEDPIALQLSWPDIAEAQLQQESSITADGDGKSQIRRWFFVITLNQRYMDTDRIKVALEFERQRKPAHFKIDELKHALFVARKNRASDAELVAIKAEIAHEKRQHPGRQSKARFHDRPVVWADPDQLRVAWTHITPGRQKLRQLLAQRTRLIGDRQQRFEIEKPMTESAFRSLLATLLERDETIEAVKLVKVQMGLNTTEARSFVEKNR